MMSQHKPLERSSEKTARQGSHHGTTKALFMRAAELTGRS